MKAIMRISLLYFRAIPAQLWMTLAGLAVLAISCAFRPLNKLLPVGQLLILGVPVVFGGVLMQNLSAGGAFLLRPQARWKMLCAAQLAILLATSIYFVSGGVPAQLGLLPNVPEGVRLIENHGMLKVFVGAWATITLIWTFVFTATIYPQAGFAAIFITAFGASWLDRHSPSFAILPTLAVIAWGALSIWYLHVRRIRGFSQAVLERSRQPTAHTALPQRWLQTCFDNGCTSRHIAVRAFVLGSPSLLKPGLSGFFVSVGMGTFMAMRSHGENVPPFFNPPTPLIAIFILTTASTAIVAARRARGLWLRAGISRHALFAKTERQQLTSYSLATLGVAIPVAALSIWLKPDFAAANLLGIAAQISYGLALNYLGLALVRGARLLDVSLCLVAGLLWLALLMYPIVTHDTDHTAFSLAGIAGSLLLATALRRFARARWQNIDWHLVRPLTAGRPLR